jgi:hypothetical protein
MILNEVDHLRVAGTGAQDRDGQPRSDDCIRILALDFIDTHSPSRFVDCFALGSLFRRLVPINVRAVSAVESIRIVSLVAGCSVNWM